MKIIFFLFVFISFSAYCHTDFNWLDSNNVFFVNESQTKNIDKSDPIGTRYELSTVNMSYSISDTTPSLINGGYIQCDAFNGFSLSDGWSFQLELSGQLGNAICSSTSSAQLYDPIVGNHTTSITGKLVLIKTKAVAANTIIVPAYLSVRYNEDSPKPYGGQVRSWSAATRTIDIPLPSCSAVIYYNGHEESTIDLNTIFNWSSIGNPSHYSGEIFSIRPSTEEGCDSSYYSSVDIQLLSSSSLIDGIPVLDTNSSQWGWTLKEISESVFWRSNTIKTVPYTEDDLISFNVNYFRKTPNSAPTSISGSAIFNVTFK
ncbi:TPA: hypothetical protein ACX6QU_001342 [Photobacterium damselae]